MNTPLSSRRRKGPKWLMETRRLNISSGSDASSSTPSHLRHSGATFSPMTPSADYNSFDEEELLMPSTQMFNQKREVYWDYEASPNTRAELQRQIAEIDAKEEKLAPPRPPKPKPAKPVSKVKRTKPALPSFSEIIAKDEDVQFLNQLVLNMKNQSNEENSGNGDNQISDNVDAPEKSDSSDPFDEDDSFLVECSQAIEEKALTSNIQPNSIQPNCNHEFKMPSCVEPSTSELKASTSHEVSVFDDDDDEFEMMLSQIEIPEAPKTTVPSSRNAWNGSTTTGGPVMSRTLRPSSVNPPASNNFVSKSTAPFNQPTNSRQDKICTNLFKRFKSADDAAKGTSTSSTSRPPVTSQVFRRNNSEPQTPPGLLPGGRQKYQSAASKCSKEEIERKRQEAMRRRHLSSQKLK